ncbi:DUF4959 domain-containing protein [Mucilaginibacter kameinonensis]|uniref:DUF4959 domain-containing protein n=1 Tax=Mucilaginibacter kameinonensis TaxID=452286 RepID=UPI001FC9BBE8|nr:DUF4959 domain-containing protein [Mucilaginibacter kameinonensis]
MKKVKNILLLLSFSIMTVILSCKRNDGYNDPVSKDPTKPGVVSNVKVTDYNGGSYITYDLPNSENILYVLASYSIRNGVTRETKASYYSDTVNVEGFAKAQEYNVTLYTVSRSNVKSDPVTVKVHPLTPVYELVRQDLSLQSDFGGVNVKSLNLFKKDIGVVITAFNQSTHQMEVEDQHYTNTDTIDYSLRGYSTASREFGVYVTDKFGNVSDTLKHTLSPLLEVMLDKSLFSTYLLPSDTPIGYGWVTSNLWDGRTDGSSAGWHTEPGHTPPFVTTFNVGKSYKLSRFVIWERPDDGQIIYSFAHGNPKFFTLWGSNAPSPKDASLPLSSAVGTVVGDWINLGNFRYPNPPSGLPPISHNAADNAFVLAGVNFNVSIDDPAIHFLRFSVSQNWENGDIAHFMEISLYGQPQ